MKFVIFFRGHLLADLDQGILQALAGGLAEKVGELAEANSGLFASFRVLMTDACGVFEEDASCHVGFTASEKFFDVLMNVAWRDAPSFGGHQNTHFAGFGDSGPELAIENVGVRLHGDSGAGHFVFARAQKLAQGAKFLAHAVEHLTHGVHLHFAALKTVHSEFNGQIFSQAQEHSLVHFGRRGFRGDLR